MRTFILFFSALILIAAPFSSAFAMDVATAKAEGLVGERPDGLLGVVNPPGSMEVQLLVKDTNEGRMRIYIGMSQRQKVSLPQIQAIAAENLIARTTPGQYVFSNGNWVKK